jgi:branched-chain amino acid transport system permease protein
MIVEVLGNLSRPIIMGILLGGLYALIALGLSMVFGVMKLINVAHGDLMIFGAYFAYAVTTAWGIDPILSLTMGIPLWFILGFAIQKYVMSRAFGISMEAPLIIAFGISLILQSLAQIIWSPYSRGLTAPYALGGISLGITSVPRTYLLSFVAALVVMLLLREFLRRSYLGKAIVAASQDKRGAELVGINTGRVYAFAFAIAMATAAIAGVFFGLTFPFTPTSGVGFLVIAFGVVIIGGLGSMLGTFIGGIVLGLTQTLSGYFLGTAAQMLFVYLIVFVVLAVRPQGIFGR